MSNKERSDILKRKKIINIFLISGMVLMLAGCDEVIYEETGAVLEEDTTAVIGKDKIVELQEKEKTNVDMKHTEKLNDEEFIFHANYAIDKEQEENWYYTQSFSIDLGINIESVPQNYKVYVSQVYADISLLSPSAKYNGLRQDSMNIEYFTLPNGGVSINETNGYSVPFQIEGVNKSEIFISVWQGTGHGGASRITEDEIAKVTEGTVLNVVWTVLLEDETGQQFVKTINDKIGIPYYSVDESGEE